MLNTMIRFLICLAFGFLGLGLTAQGSDRATQDEAAIQRILELQKSAGTMAQEIYSSKLLSHTLSKPVSADAILGLEKNLLTIRDHINSLLKVERSPVEISELASGRKVNQIVENYFKLLGIYLVAHLYDEYKDKTSHELQHFYQGKIPPAEALAKIWKLETPADGFFGIYNEITQVPVELTVNLIQKGQRQPVAQLYPNREYFWGKMMEALSAVDPEKSYMAFVKCQLSAVTIAKYAKTLQVLGQSWDSQGINVNSMCMGIPSNWLYEKVKVKHNQKWSEGLSGGSPHFLDSVIREKLTLMAPSADLYLSQQERELIVKKSLSLFVDDNGQVGVWRADLFLDNLGEHIIDEENFVDPYDQSLLPAGLTIQAKEQVLVELSEISKDPAKNLSEKYVNKRDFEHFYQSYLLAAERFKNTSSSAAFDFFELEEISNLFIGSAKGTAIEHAVESFFNNKFSEQNKLTALEHYYFKYTIGIALQYAPIPLDKLHSGELTDTNRYLLDYILRNSKGLSAMAIVKALKSAIILSIEDINEGVLEDASVVAAAVRDSYFNKIRTMVDERSRSGKLDSFYLTWLSRSLKNIKDQKAQEYNKFKTEITNGSVEARLYVHPELLKDNELPYKGYWLYEALRFGGSLLEPKIVVSNRVHEWMRDFVHNSAEKPKNKAVSGEDNEHAAKLFEVIDLLLEKQPGLADIDWKSDRKTRGLTNLFSSTEIPEKDIADYRALNRLAYMLGYSRTGADRTFKGFLNRLNSLDLADAKRKALLLIYRKNLQREKLSQHKVLEMPVKIEDKEQPLYEVLGKAKKLNDKEAVTLDQGQELALRQAVSRVALNIKEQIDVIQKARNIKDLSAFIIESKVINKMLGEEDKNNILASLSLGPLEIFNIPEERIKYNRLAFLQYHERQQEQMRIHHKREESRVQSLAAAYNAPVFSYVDQMLLAKAMELIMTPFSDAESVANQQYGSKELYHIDDHTPYISMLDIALINAFLPARFGGAFVKRYVDANTRFKNGYWKLFLPMIVGEAGYNYVVTRPKMLGEVEDLRELAFTELDSSEVSFVKIDDLQAGVGSRLNQLDHYQSSLYMAGAFVAFPFVAKAVSKVWQRGWERGAAERLEFKAKEIFSRGESFGKKMEKLRKRNDKLTRKNLVYFWDLGLKERIWDPRIINKAYHNIVAEKSMSYSQKYRARIAYEKLMLQLSKEFRGLEGLPNAAKLRALSLFPKNFEKETVAEILSTYPRLVRFVHQEAGRIRDLGRFY